MNITELKQEEISVVAGGVIDSILVGNWAGTLGGSFLGATLVAKNVCGWLTGRGNKQTQIYHEDVKAAFGALTCIKYALTVFVSTVIGSVSGTVIGKTVDDHNKKR